MSTSIHNATTNGKPHSTKFPSKSSTNRAKNYEGGEAQETLTAAPQCNPRPPRKLQPRRRVSQFLVANQVEAELTLAERTRYAEAPKVNAIKPRKRRIKPIEGVLRKLENVTECSDGQWSACCPAHIDQNPSLSISEAEDGKVLLYCHAGCEPENIVAAIDLSMPDLWPGRNSYRARRRQTRTPVKKEETSSKNSDTRNSEVNWEALAKTCRINPDSPRLFGIDTILGISAHSLYKIGVGWHDAKECLVFPERDGSGRVVGLIRLTDDGYKAMKGGKRGLIIPIAWQMRIGPLLLVEGPSDTATANQLELAVIGRPQATSKRGVEFLVTLLKDFPTERKIIVVGEWDQKSDGKWPGKTGAVKTASALSKRLKREVLWALPPDRAKDTREWYLAKRKEIRDRRLNYDEVKLGQELLEGLETSAKVPTAEDLIEIVPTDVESIEEAEPVEEDPAEEPHADKGANDDPEPGEEVEVPEHDVAEEEPQDDDRIPTFSLIGKTNVKCELRRPLIHGLLREGETANIISSTKAGKSWLVDDLALCVATGRPWLGFETERGDVLVVDNELHKETMQYRTQMVAEARKIKRREVHGKIEGVQLRGDLTDIYGLGVRLFDHLEVGRFKLIVIDALYRALPDGISESDNASMAMIYNEIDYYAARLGCSFVLVHHASKGNQSAKSVTDVGSGAGSQSRAADTHLVLRPHEEPEAVVLDAAVRSWPPLEPFGLRWKFPVFMRDDNLDPTKLRREKPGRTDQELQNSLLLHLQDVGSDTRGGIRGKLGIGDPKAKKIIEAVLRINKIEKCDVKRGGRGGQQTHQGYRIVGDVPTDGAEEID